MHVGLSLTEAAHRHLLELCTAQATTQPIAMLHWQEPTADFKRGNEGTTILERVAGNGSILVVPSHGKVPPESILYVQGIPFLRDALPEGNYSLRVHMSSGSLVIERYVA